MTPATNFKLGLFVMTAFASLAVAALALGLQARHTKTVAIHTSFDETVQGLERGAQVKYRGVPIGRVASIAVAPDRRHIDVELAIDADSAARLGLAAPPPLLRTRLESQGLTSVKLVDLDFAAEANAAATTRGFIPSEPSLGKQLEEEGVHLAHALPTLVDESMATLHRLDRVLDDASDSRVTAHVVALIDEARTSLAEARLVTPRIAASAAEAGRALADVRGLIKRLDDVTTVAGDDVTTVAGNVRRTADAFREIATRALDTNEDLQQTLHEIGDASRALRAFLDDLDRDPDMLVKGHARARAR